jgi:hypothetical protein
MEDQPTCGKGIAASAVLPEKLSDVVAGLAGVLETHMLALEVSDDDARREHEAYARLAKEHRAAAAQLAASAAAMAGYRDLPMAPHDMAAMTDGRALDAFQRFVGAKRDLLVMLQASVADDDAMLEQMRSARTS